MDKISALLSINLNRPHNSSCLEFPHSSFWSWCVTYYEFEYNVLFKSDVNEQADIDLSLIEYKKESSLGTFIRIHNIVILFEFSVTILLYIKA